MVNQHMQAISNIHESLKLKYENIDFLDLIKSKGCMENGCKKYEFSMGSVDKSLSNIRNPKYYIKQKLEDLKIQTFDYKLHFKKSCFNCSSSFHGSSYEDGHFNLQKMPEIHKKCDICQKNYTTERSFYHNCNICNASFQNCQILYNHRSREHKAQETHQCVVCHISLFDRDLEQHILKHNLPYLCPYCNKRFGTKPYLMKHILGVCTPGFDKKFKCKLCPKEFNDKYRFKKHQDFHAKLYACKYCDKYFSSKSLLKGHSFAHTKNYPYNCSICNKGFPYKKTYSNHILTHTGEKPFACKYCPNQYKTKYTLDLHLFKHTGGKQFKCDSCDKTFAKQFLLNNHKLNHMEKSCQCTICSKFYKKLGDLRWHMRTVHKLSGSQLPPLPMKWRTPPQNRKANVK